MKKRWFSMTASVLGSTALLLLCLTWGASHTVSGAAIAAPLDATATAPPLADSPPLPSGEVAPVDVKAVDNGAEGGWVIECVDCPADSSTPGISSLGYPDLKVDSEGYAHIAHTKDDYSLEYVYQDASGWHIENLGSGLGYPDTSVSLALDQDGYPHLSYYVSDEGSLKYAYQDASGWHSDTVDTQSWYPSLALDSNGYPHISYLKDATDVIYAYKDASGWHSDTVDSLSYWEVDGTCLALEATAPYTPHVSYYTWSDLSYAYYDGSSWQTQFLGNTYHNASLSLDEEGYPHIGYYLDQSLMYMYQDETGWYSQTVDSGGVGRYASLALDGSGYPHISYYDGTDFDDDTNHDLKYAYQDASGWHTQTLDGSDFADLGKYTSLDLDTHGYAHIAYFNDTHDTLSYSYQDGSGWHIQPKPPEGLGMGRYTSLALSAEGYVHISYYDGIEGDLKYAYQDASGWHSQTVDSAGSVGSYTSLALAPTAPYTPHISYFDATNQHPKYAYLDANGWHSQTVGTGFPAGWYTSLVLDDNGYPHISYYCQYFGSLHYTRQVTSAGWSDSVVAYYSESWNKVGTYNSLALDSNGKPWISYYDEFLHALRVATGWGWSTMSTVDSVAVWDTSLVMKGTYAHISYYDALHSMLKYAFKDASGWHSQVIDIKGIGRYTSLALDADGHPHISYYDATLGNLKYAFKDASGWHNQTIESESDVGRYTSLALDADGHPHISYYDAERHGLKHAYFSTQPIAAFTADPTTGIAPLTVTFTDTSSGGEADTWLWSFGDGVTSTRQSPTHTYTAAGAYTVTLTISGPGGDDTLTRANYITVTEPSPVAGFTAYPVSGEWPLTVVFTDTSTGAITAWGWTFGDGGVSSQQNPTHTYTSAGIYTVSLTVNGAGGSDTLVRTNYITITEPPSAPQVDFVGAPRNGDAPLTVQFTSTITGTVTAYGWRFGDDGIADTPNPTHTYANAGSFGVTLVVTGPGGTANVSKPSYIMVNPPPGAPTATFSADVVSGTAPLTVTFTAITSGTVEHWLWHFGDGGTAFTGPMVNHTYVTSGTFDVSLTVSNTHGSFVVSKPDYIAVREKGDESYYIYLPLVMRSL